jgi:UDP-N-acetylmuramate: L-alanyl-gamma-D-glutamyl-meso-diaminopimelate ligase
MIYYQKDDILEALANANNTLPEKIAYDSFEHFQDEEGETFIRWNEQEYPLQIFGSHNFANLKAAYEVCKRLGIDDATFFTHASTFKGAARRLELMWKEGKRLLYKDFAHAPSKVKATVAAVRQKYPEHQLVVALELHTYSSLQQDFIVQYKDALAGSDAALVYVDEEALRIKKKEKMDPEWLQEQFGQPVPIIAEDEKALSAWLHGFQGEKTVFLMMSSGHWGGFDLKTPF